MVIAVGVETAGRTVVVEVIDNTEWVGMVVAREIAPDEVNEDGFTTTEVSMAAIEGAVMPDKLGSLGEVVVMDELGRSELAAIVDDGSLASIT